MTTFFLPTPPQLLIPKCCTSCFHTQTCNAPSSPARSIHRSATLAYDNPHERIHRLRRYRRTSRFHIVSASTATRRDGRKWGQDGSTHRRRDIRRIRARRLPRHKGDIHSEPNLPTDILQRVLHKPRSAEALLGSQFPGLDESVQSSAKRWAQSGWGSRKAGIREPSHNTEYVPARPHPASRSTTHCMIGTDT